MQANKHMPEKGKADDKDPLDYSAALADARNEVAERDTQLEELNAALQELNEKNEGLRQ